MHIHPRSTSPTRRRGIVSGLASLALAVSGSLVALPPSALADTTLDLTANQNVVDRPSDSFTADSLPTVQIDSGVVRKQVISGNTVFVGGKFSNARPAGAAPGTGLVGRSNLMSYDITTGVMTDWNPQVNGEVTALAVSPDGSRLYVGGSFTQVDGQARSNLAAFDTATGQLVADFAPAVNAQVGVILATNDAVYLGGYFTNVAGSTRLRLAALTPAGALTAWAPTADGYVGAMALTAQGSHLVVGGQFAYVNGAVAQGSAALDVATGTSLPWAANTVITNHGGSSGIYSLVADGDDVLATGWKYNTSSEGNFEGVVRLSGSTGQVVWMADCHGDSYGAVASHGLVYSVSHHHNCQNMGNFSDQGVFERAQAFTGKATSTTLTNQSGGYANFAGQPAPSQVAWAPALEAGTATGADQAAWNITSDDRYLLMGGEFPTVNGQNQQGIARFAAGSLATHQAGPARWAATPWSARATAVGNSVRVSVPINYDYDGLGLTYEVHRTDRSAALYTVSANSVWWTKNSIAFTDTSVEPNTHYDYYVTATDADGNTQRSNTAPVTTGAKANTAYQDLLMAGSPTHLWRLDDPAGSAQAADLAGASDLVPTSGVTFGQPGAVTAGRTGATLAGGQSSAYEENPEAGPSDYTAELWFKTTTTTGGRLLGFGNAATGSSWSYDRNVWMGDDGRINYGNYSNGLHHVVSPQAYNDGQWHHVATTSSPTRGTILYVDGVQVAQTDGYASDTYTGYWRIGQGTMGGWPNTPTGASFTGSIDEVAVYGKALSAQAIRSHYLAATGESVTASPYDPYGKAVYQAQPRLYWRLDQTSGTVAQDASGLADDGTVSGDTTWGAASTVAPGTALGVNGGQVVSPRPVTNPLVFSLEGWVRTTSTTGGRILGLGDKTSGTSSHYDRALWTDASGKVHFGVYAGREVVLTSPSAINDGQWHQVAATLDPSAGMVLYVDGVAVASDPNTSAESYTGYWRAGADQTWDGAGSNIGGDLDELAVYDRAVTADEVAKRYALKGYETSTNQLPTASFTATTDGMSATVDGSASSDPDGTIGSLRWDFGDGTTATGAKATHVYTTEGTHTITLTVTDNLGGTATTTQQVTTAKPVVTDGTVALDDFSSVGSDWGAADAGGAWTVSKANVFSRDGASGIASIAKGADVKARLADVNALDTTAVLDESIDKLPGGGGLYSRLHVRDQGNTSYAAMLRWQSNGALRLAVIRYVGGVQSGELGGYDIPAGYTAGKVYRVKLSATGTNPTVVTASAWPADGTEPATPQVTVKDTTAALQASGGVSVSGYLSGASTVSPVTLRVDGLRATGTNPTVAPTATPTATPTSTPTATPTSTPTDTPTPTPTPTVVETPVVTDAFGGTRTRWGSADLGGTYTYGTSSAFTTANGQGVMTVPKGVTARASLPVTAGNLRTGAKLSFGSLPSAGSLYTRVEAHVQPNGDRLWAAVRLTSTGTMQLSVSQVVGGVQTDLKTVDVPGTYTPGTVVRLDFTLDTANGQTVGNARLLPLDQDTPLAQAQGTSTAASVQSAGTVGLSSYLSSTAQSPVAVQVDDYVVATH